MKTVEILVLWLLAVLPACCLERASGFCDQGAVTLTVAGFGPITQQVQGVTPGCKVNILISGTSTSATIYSNNLNPPTPLSNPFPGDANTAYWFAYAAEGRYDIRILDPTGSIVLFTFGDVLLFDPLSPTNIGGVLYASAFSGATTNAQALAACNSLSSTPGVVIISSTMTADQTPESYPQGCTIIDYRGLVGPNQFGTEGTTYTFNNLFREQFNTAPNAVQNYGPLALFEDDEQGGFNTGGGPKTTYITENLSHVSRTQGTHFGSQELLGCLSEGDCVGHINFVSEFGGSNATGDEGAEAFHFEADQGNGPGSSASSNLATATVQSAVSGGGTTTLTVISGVNLQLLGELRWVLDTNASKIYSTGTVTSITGVPPVVLGSGTSWNTLTGGQYCFSLNNNANGTLLQAVPVRTITDATHITLGYSVQGSDKAWAGTFNSGSYQLFPCSQIAKGGLPGGLGGTLSTPVTTASIVVNNGYTGWAASDTLQVPLGFDGFIGGNFVNIGPQLPMGIIPVGEHIVNLAPKLWQPETWGLVIGGSWGPFSRGIEVGPGGSSNMNYALSCNDGATVSQTLGYCTYAWQTNGNIFNGWGWNTGTDTGKIGFDRTSGQFSIQDGTNGNLLQQDNAASGALHTGPIVMSLTTHQVVGNFTLSAGWGTGSSITTLKNDSVDEGGLLVFQTGTGTGSKPTVTMAFQHSFTSVVCNATFSFSTSIASALVLYNEPTNVQFQWPDNGLPASASGATPPTGSTINLTWICQGLL